jgi:hypothetical protein
VLLVFGQDGARVCLAEDEAVVEKLAAQGAGQALAGRARGHAGVGAGEALTLNRWPPYRTAISPMARRLGHDHARVIDQGVMTAAPSTAVTRREPELLGQTVVISGRSRSGSIGGEIVTCSSGPPAAVAMG